MARFGPGSLATGKADAEHAGPLAFRFRFLVAVDVEGFSQRHAAAQARAQDELESVMMQAAASVGLGRGRWYRQPRGDGELAVLPQGASGLLLVADYPRGLAARISDLNHAADNGSRLRVRLAIHHGAVLPGRFGPVGAAPVVTSRLVDAEPVRRQLRQRADLDVALIVSATVYEEVVQSRLHGLNPEVFDRIIVRAKGKSYAGYLHRGIPMEVTDQQYPGAPEAAP